jgi:hypothetical protein
VVEKQNAINYKCNLIAQNLAEADRLAIGGQNEQMQAKRLYIACAEALKKMKD